jgi:2-haloacid dehalogenase
MTDATTNPAPANRAPASPMNASPAKASPAKASPAVLRLEEIDACVFDAYGTLFDTSSAVDRCRGALGDAWQSFAQLWRRKQLEYSWLRSLMGRHTDFWHVTAEALDYTFAAFRRNDPQLRALLLQEYLSLQAFPGVRDLLARLKAAGKRTALLSNGSPTMLTALVSSAGLSRLLDAVLSVEAAGVYKPHPSVYQLAADRLSAAANRILFFSSNGWDVQGAAAFGFRAIWINRALDPPEQLPGDLAATVGGLDEVPALLGVA